MTFLQFIKDKWFFGGVAIRIIAINVIIFLIINLFKNIDGAFMLRDGQGTGSWINDVFLLNSDFMVVLSRPWTLITHMFAHISFMHLLMNMMMFYFGSQIFKLFLGDKRLLYFFVFGGLSGAFAQILAASYIPFFTKSFGIPMLGASAAVSAVIMAVAFYKPTYEVLLFGLIRVKLIYIAFILFLSFFLKVTETSQVAHIAHLGGALFGVLAILRLNRFDRFIGRLDRFFWIFSGGFSKIRSRIFMRKKVEAAPKHFHKADEQYFESKKEIQAKVDAILDKIRAKGYDGLSKAEKDYLFTHKDRL